MARATNALVLNAGSSSIKASLFSIGPGPIPPSAQSPLWEGEVDWTHQEGKADLRVRTATGKTRTETIDLQEPIAGIAPLLDPIWGGPDHVLVDAGEIDVVGHRLVHGGDRFLAPIVITHAVRSRLLEMVPLAPLHLGLEIEIIDEVARHLGGSTPQVATFDTAFHATIPPAAHVYPGPFEWYEDGIRRFGFHGISYQYTTRRAAALLGKDPDSVDLISCHLGRGCSAAAIRKGKSVDTTMGFTPLEGLMMGSRSGSIDPGILIYLMRSRGYGRADLDRILNQESGLLGISGVSGDMERVIEAMEKGNPRARLAFDIFVHSVRSHVASMMASLGRVPDALVFSGGIGEHSAPVREAVCAGLGMLGWRIEAGKSAVLRGEDGSETDGDIAAADSTVRILVIHTRENWQIATECLRMKLSPRATHKPRPAQG
jgi:acetate kinase